jgi:hypothetical protein
MRPINTYLREVLGLHLELQPPDRTLMNKLPMYLKEGYRWQQGLLAKRPCLFAELSTKNAFGIAQIDKHFHQVRHAVGLPVIAVFPELEAYNRKRLIERHMAFVVPGKQVYIPEFFIDLKEYRGIAKKEHARLTPIGQLVFLFHILDKTQTIENKTFKELAPILGTNPMGITRAVESLKQHELIDVTGDKEKFIHFTADKQQLWKLAEEKDILLNPVLRKIYVDEKPKGVPLYYGNMSALAEYTNMNPGSQDFYAIEKSVFYALQKNKLLTNSNELEGKYCLEVWKYSPERLAEVLPNRMHTVDPLSLYLSLKGSNDERIEMALEQLISAVW